MLTVSLVMDLYIIIGAKITYNESIADNARILIALPFICGPSVGYGVYNMIKNRTRYREDIDFRSKLLLSTTFKILIILYPLWGIAKVIGII
jgi:hypothetical protein